MAAVREIVDTAVVEALWSAGYTILPRHRGPDPFEIEQRFIPRDRFYQWFHLVHDKPRFMNPAGQYCGGWGPVPASRHDGYFMPAGHVGNIEVNGLGLFEKPRDEAEQDLKANEAKAHKLVDDWVTAQKGFSGHITVGDKAVDFGPENALHRNPATKTIDTTVGIPQDMFPFLSEVFAERDRLEADVVQKDRTLKPGKIADLFHAAVKDNERDGTSFQWWPTLRAILLPIAVDNVRAKRGMEPTLLRRMKDELEKLQQNPPALEPGSKESPNE